jgi:rubrerythrin
LSELTLEGTLKFALTREEESIKLYISAQKKVLNPGSSKFLKELAEEEKTHKSKILGAMKDPKKIKEIGTLETKIQDLKIVDYLEDVTLSPEADYQQILIYAAKKEKTTHDLYMELAGRYKEKHIGKMFAKLAQEELKHKYRLEKEYDEVILKYM